MKRIVLNTPKTCEIVALDNIFIEEEMFVVYKTTGGLLAVLAETGHCEYGFVYLQRVISDGNLKDAAFDAPSRKEAVRAAIRGGRNVYAFKSLEDAFPFMNEM